MAAAWGCRRGLELLLGHGADPALRDQVGAQRLQWQGGPGGSKGGREEGREEDLGCPLLTAPPQDGLRPLDLAKQQGHQDCARVLREFQTQTKTSTRTRAESQEPEPEPEPDGEWGLRLLGGLTSDLALRVPLMSTLWLWLKCSVSSSCLPPTLSLLPAPPAAISA